MSIDLNDPEAVIASLPPKVHRDVRAGLDAAVQETLRIAHLSRPYRGVDGRFLR